MRACARVCARVYVYGHSPQELRRAPRNRSIVVSPLGHYAKRSEEAAKRQGVEHQGRTERRSEVETRLLFFVLATKSLCQLGCNANIVTAQRGIAKNAACLCGTSVKKKKCNFLE